jgi:hypothetical protein
VEEINEHTHTHTHTHIYIYIYIESRRGRVHVYMFAKVHSRLFKLIHNMTHGISILSTKTKNIKSFILKATTLYSSSF